MEMPKVSRCNIAECAFNMDDQCDTMGITIGGAVHPRCDTPCMAVNQELDTSSF